jgi:hypothetical protein
MTQDNTTTSRRAVLAGITALATGTAANVAAIAVAKAALPDPIYAVIKEWIVARDHNQRVLDVISELENRIPETRMTWHCTAYDPDPPEGCADDPDWIAANIALNCSYRQWEQTLPALFTTKPTTVAGIIALLDIVGATTAGASYPCKKYGGEEPLLFYMEGWNDDPVADAVHLFPQTLAAALGDLLN